MQLETESNNGGRAFGVFDPVTEETLRKVFGDDFNFGTYVRLNNGKADFMQAGVAASGREGDGPFDLEYCEGDSGQFAAAGEFSKADVLRAFSSYLAGDNRWRTEFTWQILEIKKPKWKFW